MLRGTKARHRQRRPRRCLPRQGTDDAHQPNGLGSCLPFLPHGHVSGGSTYTDVLPSLNLGLELAERRFLRLGFARSLARGANGRNARQPGRQLQPQLGRLHGFANSPWGGSGGNPALKPWVTDALDLSFEWYFEDGLGYLALAGFYKDLRIYIYLYERPILVDFSSYPTGDVQPALTEGIVSRPDSGDGGKLQGLEFTVSASGEMPAPARRGFGVVFDASLTDSEIDRGTGDPSTPLPGLSEKVANLTFYYEAGGFSARVSGNFRSDFLGEVAGFQRKAATRKPAWDPAVG